MHYKTKFDTDEIHKPTDKRMWKCEALLLPNNDDDDDDDNVIVEIFENEPPIQEKTQKIWIHVSHNYIEQRSFDTTSLVKSIAFSRERAWKDPTNYTPRSNFQSGWNVHIYHAYDSIKEVLYMPLLIERCEF